MGESRTKNVIKNTGAGIGVRLLSILLNFVLKTVFIRVLGIQYTGVSSLFTDILTILSFAELGIGSAITYALYKPVAQNDKIQIAKLMNFYKKAYRYVALTVAVAGGALVPFLGFIVKDVPDIKESITLIYLLYLVNTIVSYLLIYKSSILVARQKKYVISVVQGTSNVLKLLVESVLIVIYHQFIVYLVIEIIFTIAQNYIIGRLSDWEYRIDKNNKTLVLEKAEKTKLFADIRALAMYQISGVVVDGADSVIISAFLETSLVGYISYYKLIFNQISRIVIQFFDAMNPSVGNLAVTDEADKQYKLFKNTNFAIFWLMCAACTGLAVCVNPLIKLWLGEQFLLSENIVMVLTADFFVTNMIRVVAVFRTANGLFVNGKYRPVIMAILNIVLSVIMVKPLGIFGVLLATVVSRVVTQMWYDPWLIYSNIFSKRNTDCSVMEYYASYIKYLLTIIASIILAKLISKGSSNLILLEDNSLVQLLVAVVTSIIVSNAVFFLLWGRNDNCRYIMEKFKHILKKWRCKKL